MDLIPVEDDTPEPQYDMTTPETVVFEVLVDEIRNTSGDWKGFAIGHVQVHTPDGRNPGSASYENGEVGLMDFTLESMLECPKAEGLFAVDDFTGHYTRGDGWMTDDSADFTCGPVRPATEDEKAGF